MKRFSVLAAALLLCLGLLGCAPDDDAALTVNGEEVMTVGELEDLLDELADDDEYLTAHDARGAGAGTLDSSVSTTILTRAVYSAVLSEELEAEGIEITEADRTRAEETAEQILLTGSPETGVDPVDPAEIPAAFVESLEVLYSRYWALSASLSDDPAEGDPLAGARLGELLLDTEVEVAERFGSWAPIDEETGVGGEVVAPEGPVAPSTTIPLPVPAGG